MVTRHTPQVPLALILYDVLFATEAFAGQHHMQCRRR